MYTLSNSEEPHEMLLKMEFHLDMYCLLRYSKSSGTEMCCVLIAHKYKIDYFILIVSIFMNKSIRMKKVNGLILCLALKL